MVRHFYACYWCNKRQVRHAPESRMDPDGSQLLYLCTDCAAEYDRQEAAAK